MSLTLSETGKVLTETFEGITMPADYSFDTINDFVHGVDVQFEELQALCLGMACYIDRLNKKLVETATPPSAKPSKRGMINERTN